MVTPDKSLHLLNPIETENERASDVLFVYRKDWSPDVHSVEEVGDIKMRYRLCTGSTSQCESIL